jgi:raffinose/stachyose/melibiose transport system substrate-binding protein
MKKSILGAVILVAAVGLAGCTAANPTAPAANGKWNPPTAKLKGVTLTLWTEPATSTYADQVISAFQKATGAKVTKVVLPDDASELTKVATGDLPDIAWWQPTRSAMSVLLPTKNLQSLDSAPWLSKIEPSLKDDGVINKVHYAAMVSTPSVLGMFYNKADFKKAGITTDPGNWNDLLADAKKLKAVGIDPFYEAGGDGWPSQWWPQVQLAEAAKAGFWTRVNENKASFTSPEMQRVITRYQGMINDGLFNSDIKTATFDDQGTHILDGSGAMVLQDSSAFLGLVQGKLTAGESVDSKLGWFPISTDGTIATTIPTGANGLVAFKTGDPKREAATRQLLRFWLETDYPKFIASLKTSSIEPGVPNPAGLPKINSKIKAALSNSIGSMQSLAVINPDLWNNLQDMINGGKTPLQVGQVTQAQFAELAKAQGIPGY